MLLLWGREDRTISWEELEQVQKAIPSVKFKAIGQAGHIPQYERPETVNPVLVGFFRQR